MLLNAKAIFEAADDEPGGYLCLELPEVSKMVELEEQLTLFVKFSTNQPSLWNVMVRQADEFFKFQAEHQPDAGQSCVERTYQTPTSRFGVILCNELIDGEIHVQITLPISERALDNFLAWNATPAGCCKFFAELLKIALAEESQRQHYVAGGLLGDPTK